LPIIESHVKIGTSHKKRSNSTSLAANVRNDPLSAMKLPLRIRQRKNLHNRQEALAHYITNISTVIHFVTCRFLTQKLCLCGSNTRKRPFSSINSFLTRNLKRPAGVVSEVFPIRGNATMDREHTPTPATSSPPTYDYQYLADSWPSPIVKRSEIKEFTQGLYSKHTLSALDRKKLGPPSFKHGGCRAYTTSGVVAWLNRRSAL